MHSVNAAFRFLLEIAALAGLGRWGWVQTDGFWKWVLVAALPIAAAVVWGVFAVPDDPSRSGRAPVRVPGILRLVLELLILGGSAALTATSGWAWPGIVFAGAIVIHYLVSHERIVWLLRQPGNSAPI